MSQNIQPSSGRLYLSKEPIVYVELGGNRLEQHHIDGIRFLYKQFNKKNPGVILNDPLGYSHTLQVVLFINAIRTLISRAVLILCHHSNLSDWRECFEKWTKSSDDLAIDVSNPFLKKSIFISPIDKLERFCRRDWAITVVDHDDFLRNKQHSSQLSADYKIYVTPHDMKENLDKFSAIFKWFHPKGQLNVEEFRPNTKNLRDVIAKSVIFQAFVEDIVLRRSIILSQPDTNKTPLSPVNRVTKKNKDATGTKIKRSKRKVNDSTEVPNIDSKIRCDIDLAGSRYHITNLNSNDLNISNDNDVVLKDQCDFNSAMDVESFIRNQEPIQSDIFRDFVEDFDDDISQYNSQNEDIKEVFQNNNELDNKDAKFVSVSKDNDETVECTESSMQLHYSEDTFQNLNTNEKYDDQLLPQSDKIEVDNEVEYVLSEVKMGLKIGNEKITPSNESCNPMNVIAIDSIELEAKTENGLSKNEVIEPESEKRAIVNKKASDKKIMSGGKDLNDKLKELEEKSLHKFKGSLLDRLF